MLKSKHPTYLNSNPMQTESEKILSPLRFEPGSLGRMTDALANSATPLLYLEGCLSNVHLVKQTIEKGEAACLSGERTVLRSCRSLVQIPASTLIAS